MPNPVDQILDYLYIGNAATAQNLPTLNALGIKAVVNVAKDLNDPWMYEIAGYKVGLIDGKSHENFPYLITTAAVIVRYHMDNQEPVLLHCHEGVSRSVAVGALVVGLELDISLYEAIEYIRSKRPQACIKEGLMPLLEETWKDTLLG